MNLNFYLDYMFVASWLEEWSIEIKLYHRKSPETNVYEEI